MTEQDILELIQKQQDGNITSDELHLLKDWFEASPQNQKVYKDYCVIIKGMKIEADKQRFTNHQASAWRNFLRRLHQAPVVESEHEEKAKDKAYTLYYHIIKYAAIFILVLLLGGTTSYFIYREESHTPKVVSIYAPIGSKSYITLPDGSRVWLNSGSHITYDTDFGKEERRLTIEGEGFFSVTKDKQHPFIVTSEGTSIRVLGTKFDMKAYKGDPCKRITLMEGSLCVSTDGNQQMLKPNQQALVLHKQIQLRNVKAKEYGSWMQEPTLAQDDRTTAHDKKLPTMIVPTTQSRTSLIFDNEPLSQIVKDLGRTFNVKIQTEGKISDEVFYGDFRNGEDLYQILDIISLTADVKYKIQNGMVILYK